MYKGGATAKYEKPEGEEIEDITHVQKADANTLYKIAEGAGALKDMGKKYKSARDLISGRKFNTKSKLYFLDRKRKIYADDYFKDIKTIDDHVYKTITDNDGAPLETKAAEHYAVRVADKVFDALGLGGVGDKEGVDKKSHYNRVLETLLGLGKEQGEFYSKFVSLISQGNVQEAYTSLAEQMVAKESRQLENSIASALDLKDSDFKMKAGEELHAELSDYLKPYGKEVTKAFIQENADQYLVLHAQKGIEAVIEELDKRDKIKTKKKD